MPTKLLILDRDGVINQDSAEFIKSPDEWVPLKGSLEAIGLLTQAGYNIVVLSNQSGVGRGMFDADMLGQIHVRMLDYIHQLGGDIQCILFCPHHPDDACECRKPKTGLYDELAKRVSTSFSNVYSVGDSIRDLQAAQSAGAIPVLVKTGNGKKSVKQLEQHSEIADCLVFDNLHQFAQTLLAGQIVSSENEVPATQKLAGQRANKNTNTQGV